jgi:dTDP-glucose pyrophosphorylase
MKGIVLAGGLGTRLRPLTSVTNKHLLPVYNQPMIYYPIQTLVNAGIKEIMIVTGGNNAGDFLKLLGNGKAFGLKHLNYTYQEGEGGIAAALSLAEDFADGERVCIVLGDNIIEPTRLVFTNNKVRERRFCLKKFMTRNASACRNSKASASCESKKNRKIPNPTSRLSGFICTTIRFSIAYEN